MYWISEESWFNLRQQQKFFLFFEACVQTGCAAFKASHHVATGDLYPSVSRSVSETDHSPSFSARFKTEDTDQFPIRLYALHRARFALDP
jgi:hypothetical protein